MKSFIKVPASKASLNRRTLVRGVGVNDAGYKTAGCPIYGRWNAMLQRCYTGNKPHYIGCSVAPEWLLFSNFSAWMDDKSLGRELDKDLLFLGNKVYGPDTCLMVPQSVNFLMIDWNGTKSKYGKGVSHDPKQIKKPFRAKFSVRDRTINIGNYYTPYGAQQAYNKAKASYVKSVASTYHYDIVLSNALLNFATHLENL